MEGRVRCLGVWLCVWLSVCQVRAHSVPSEMNRTIQNLLDNYLQRVSLQWNHGGPIVDFRSLPRETPEAMVFMSSVLQMYKKLFDHMLATAATPSANVASGSGDTEADATVAKQEMQYLREMVQRLQRHCYQKQKEFLKNLTRLEHVQVNDTVVQKKALLEMTRVFEMASSLPNRLKVQNRRHRRRRQTFHSRGAGGKGGWGGSREVRE